MEIRLPFTSSSSFVLVSGLSERNRFNNNNKYGGFAANGGCVPMFMLLLYFSSSGNIPTKLHFNSGSLFCRLTNTFLQKEDGFRS